MADVTPARRNIRTEEVSYRSSVSEATFSKMGASVNFINDFQYDTHSFRVNGNSGLAAGSTATDGVYVFRYNAEIVGFSMFNAKVGTSGSMVVDMHRLTGGNTDSGSIFTVQPTVTTSSSDENYMLYDVPNATSIVLPTGFTAPTFGTTTFNQGDALRFDLDAAFLDGRDFSVEVHFRPIN